MQIAIEELIRKITREVIRELSRQNITILVKDGTLASQNQNSIHQTRIEKPDMSKYKTPILTENHIQRLHELTGEVVIPEGTVITPKARELLREKRIKITIN
ncbi:hypothetical protein JW835_04900 [bacterium]|nr:hypothetical protein [bacterium]